MIAIVFSALSARAQTPPPAFQPPPPPPDMFDWIQLKSGEWLKGELIALYDDKLEFDSDELDNLTFDWDDVRQVRTGRVVRVRFMDRTLTGRLVIDADLDSQPEYCGDVHRFSPVRPSVLSGPAPVQDSTGYSRRVPFSV